MVAKPVKLQPLIDKIGEHKALRSCAPVCFYIVLLAAGYLPPALDIATFVEDLDDKSLFADVVNHHDWSRPALSRYLRTKYKAGIVSWQLGWPPPNDLELMHRSGYIDSLAEERFLHEVVEKHTLEQLVRDGFPVIVTVNSFGDVERTNVHAIVLVRWTDNEVLVIDPDIRNSQTTVTPEYLLAHITPTGGASVVLPPNYA